MVLPYLKGLLYILGVQLCVSVNELYYQGFYIFPS